MGTTPLRSVFLAVIIPVFLAVASQTMIAVALPEIGTSLGELSRLPWLIIVYMFALTVAGPVYGTLGDMYGRRIMLASALGLYGLGSLLAGFSTNIELLTAARLVQGLGGGGLVSICQAIIGHNVESRDMGRIQGQLATVSVLANALGPVLGGILTASFGWQSLFFGALPLTALAMVLVLRLPADRPENTDRKFDYLGFLLLNAFAACCVFALEYLKQMSNEAYLYAALFGVLAVAFLLALIVTEKRAANPIFPPKLIADAAISRCYGLTIFHGAALVSLIVTLPLYTRIVLHADISSTTIVLLCLTVGLGMGGITAGNLIARTGRVASIPSVGLFVSAAVVVTVALTGHILPFAALGALLLAAGFGMGTVMPVVQTTVQYAADPAYRGSASGGVTFSRSIGSVLGTAIVTVVLFLVALVSGIDQAHIGSVLASPGIIPDAEIDVWRIAFACALSVIVAFVLGGAAAAISIPLRRL